MALKFNNNNRANDLVYNNCLGLDPDYHNGEQYEFTKHIG